MAKFRAGDMVRRVNDGEVLTIVTVDDFPDGLPYSCNNTKCSWVGWYAEDDVVPLGTPVVVDCAPKETGSPRFIALCDEMKAVHRKKGADYGSNRDIFENIRRSERIGIPASKGCWLRASDKVGRLDKFFSGSALMNESAIDSLVDLANYCLIAVVLLEEEAKGKGKDESN